MTKKCSRCLEFKAEECFSFKNKRTGRRQSHCKDCHKVYRREHYEVNRDSIRSRIAERKKGLKAWFADYKSKLQCSHCGEKHVATLQFHHVDPSDKDREVSRMVHEGLSVDSVLEEIDKCIVLCANCHSILHYNERQDFS